MEGLAAAAFCFALVGVVALVRTEKLIKTLKPNKARMIAWVVFVISKS